MPAKFWDDNDNAVGIWTPVTAWEAGEVAVCDRRRRLANDNPDLEYVIEDRPSVIPLIEYRIISRVK